MSGGSKGGGGLSRSRCQPRRERRTQPGRRQTSGRPALRLVTRGLPASAAEPAASGPWEGDNEQIIDLLLQGAAAICSEPRNDPGHTVAGDADSRAGCPRGKRCRVHSTKQEGGNSCFPLIPSCRHPRWRLQNEEMKMPGRRAISEAAVVDQSRSCNVPPSCVSLLNDVPLCFTPRWAACSQRSR